jgi:DNA segregation ATPase FtsK/SpoIIIE, S-DNA-T family
MPPRKPVRPQTTHRDEVKTIGLETNTRRPPKNPVAKTDNHYWKKIVSFFKSEITHFVVGMLLFVVLLLVGVGMISYFFTGAEDQSLMELSWSQLHQSRNEIQNTTKVAGALISHSLIHEGFGISSFAILLFAFVIAFRLIKVKIFSILKTFFHASFWLVWLSLSLGFIDFYFKPDIFFRLGGRHGVFAGEWLVSYIGETGLLLSLSGILLVYLIIVYQGTIPAIKSLFSKKAAGSSLHQHADDEDVPTVAIGTEIVPEDWVSKGKAEEEEVAENEEVEEVSESETIAAKIPDVPFEIENPVISDENKPVDAALYNGKSENEDPFYTVEKLGKYDPTLDLSKYSPPSLSLLKVYGTDNETHIDMKEQNANKERITTTLQNYGIEIKTIKATVGPTITLYEIVPKEGVRISKIKNLEYDIMLSLAATGIRIIAPIPGKGTIGIEVPNADPQIVSMHSVIASRKFQDSGFELPVAFGRTITNEIFMVDLTKLPHLLVAGATGQGKSVGLNAIITSLLYKKHPAELKLVLIDPKKVEFNIYGDIERHFLAKLPDGEDAIITDTTKVLETLSSLCKEMDNRYDLLKKAHVRNIREYNEKFVNRHLNPEKGHQFLPYIVVIVDEFGDLIMTAGKEVELPIARIAQLARAVGIHMIIATQRPSVNIITGVIKANFPARVAFRVSSMIDSRTIIDGPGANQLVGRGDMLFTSGNEVIRVQCAFVDTPEVENIVHHVARQPSYPSAFYLPEYTGPEGDGPDLSNVDMSKRDPLFEDAARLIVATQQGSTSNIQRKFSIGYNRAGRIVDQLEVAGIIGPNEGSKARQVLVMDEHHLEQILKHLH